MVGKEVQLIEEIYPFLIAGIFGVLLSIFPMIAIIFDLGPHVGLDVEPGRLLFFGVAGAVVGLMGLAVAISTCQSRLARS